MIALTTIQPKVRGILTGSLFKKGFAMVVWRVLSLVLTFATSVWIARCLGPEELGKSGFILATGYQVLLFLTVCPDNYAVRLIKHTKNHDDAITWVVTARALVSLLYLVVTAVFFAVGIIPREWAVLALLGVFVPILMAFQPVWLHQAQEDQPSQYKSGALMALAGFLYAAVFIRPGGAASEDLASRLISLIVVVVSGWWMTRTGNPFRFVNFGQIRQSLKCVWESRVTFFTPMVIYIFCGLELPLLAYLVTVEDLGKYRTAIQVAAAVQSFLVMLPLLYYPRFIEWQKISSEYLWKKQKEFFLYGLLFTIPLAISALLVAPWAYVLVFGAEYEAAGFPFAILLCAKLVVVLNGIFVWGIWARSQDSLMLWISIFVSAFSLTADLLLIPIYGMMAAATVSLISEVWILALSFWAARRGMRRDQAS